MGGAYNVSVLLPAFFRNLAVVDIDFLRRALDSVYIQDFPDDFEILLIDDGNTPRLEQWLDQVGADRLSKVRVIRNYRNQGLVYALNAGLKEALFPFVARLDADDAWRDGKIAKQMAIFKSDPDISIVATGMRLVNSAGEPFESHVRPGHWAGILQFFRDVGCPFPHGSIVARRDIYSLLGGYSHDPKFAHCEDFNLWSIWLRFFKPAMVEEELYDYTVSSQSVSGVHSEQQRLASGLVHGRFLSLDLVDRLENALIGLAEVMGCSVLDAGILAFKLWRYNMAVAVPAAAGGFLDVILNDRTVVRRPVAKGDVRGQTLTGGPHVAKTSDMVTVFCM